MTEQQQSLKRPPALSLSGNTRKTNPSPLQLSTIPTPLTDRFGSSSPQEQGPPYSRSPRSPAFQRNDALAASPVKHVSPAAASPQATPRVNPQRTVSGPAFSQANPDSSTTSDSRSISHTRPTDRLALRTASIDSTMTTSSVASSAMTQDPLSPNPSEILQLIHSAGSPEALIRSLLKEKQAAAAQNTQLWRLINKQRHLIMGLNNDLAKAAEDRERYQHRYKELANSVRIAPSQQVRHLRRSSISMNSSPARSEDDLPIQRHSIVSQQKSDNRRSASVGAEAQASLRGMQDISFAPDSITSSTDTSPSFSSTSKPRATPDSEEMNDDADSPDSRRNTIMQEHYNPVSSVAPLQIKKDIPSVPKVSIPTEPVSGPPPVPSSADSSASPSSFSARRSAATGKLNTHSPVVGTTDSEMISSPLRKGPPARLNLQPSEPPQIVLPQKPTEQGNQSDSDYDVDIDEIPAFERGRKKTRAEDDREREYLIEQHEKSRSHSKQEKKSKSTTPLTSPALDKTFAKSPAIHAIAPSGSPALASNFSNSPHASLNGMLSARSAGEQSVSLMAPPLSPGLPRSPRPGDRPQNSPMPRAPNPNGINALSPPLSLRGSDHTSALSSPSISQRLDLQSLPHTPISLSSPRSAKSETAQTMGNQKSPAITGSSISSPRLPPGRPMTPLQTPKLQSPSLATSSPRSPTKAAQEPLRSPAKSSLKSPQAVISPGHESLTRIPSENSSAASVSGGIYRGLVSEAYPDLLLPPNALPSISVKVTSSRLRPSRNSVVSIRSIEEEPVFTLGVTARSNMHQLWRVEKPIMALPQLDQQLKQVCAFDIRLPDKSLFAGHAPSKIDARREALERYFEDILDTPMNEKAAIILCHFLSVQAIPAEDFDGGMKTSSINENQHPVHLGPDGKIMKEGFLTKRGKNFGGWKARYFVLDEPILRYYESPGGALLGQIKLSNAQIGRQSAQSSAHSHSPSRNNEETEKEFRHAFLILEPKKKDSSTLLRHVLCAENDVERDEWVEALLQYIGQPVVEKEKTGRKILGGMIKGKDEANRDDSGSLQGVSYEDTVAGPSVRTGPPLPSTTTSPLLEAFHQGQIPAALNTKAISGPTGGSVIRDVEAWGNKAPDSPKSRDKEKKRSLWGFRDKTETASQSSGSSIAPAKTMLPPGSKPVFGMPLAEAVECYPVAGAAINLPAVVYRCLEYLEAKHALNEEGIFRLSGSNVTIKALKDRFNNEGDVDFLAEDTYYDVHAVASLLKLYLRELPGSVLGSRETNAQFQSVLELEDKESRIAAYNTLVHRLPPAHWTLIRALSAFLIGIVNNSAVNKMTVRNVGIVFSPTLNIPSPLFAAFLTDFDKIFTTDIPPPAALSPVMEDAEPGAAALLHRPHILAGSRPPQSRDGSVQRRRSRSRTRSRTPDRPASSQSHHIGQRRRSDAEESRTQLSQMQYPPQQAQYPPSQPQYAIPQQPQSARPFNPRSSSSQEHPSYVPMTRQRSEDSTSSLGISNAPPASSGFSVPNEFRPQRNSIAPGLAATNIMRDTKARRRESSMLIMGAPGGGGMAGSRKSSLPQLRGPVV